MSRFILNGVVSASFLPSGRVKDVEDEDAKVDSCKLQSDSLLQDELIYFLLLVRCSKKD